MRRIITVSVIGALLAGSLTGCRAEPASSGARGTVVERSTFKCRKCLRTTHYLTVKEDGTGKRDKGRVGRSVYDACQKGERWPACKAGVKS